MLKDEYKNLIDDTSSKSKELKTFIEHRHDQSMFSLVCKKFNTHLLSATEMGFCYKHEKKFNLNGKKIKSPIISLCM